MVYLKTLQQVQDAISKGPLIPKSPPSLDKVKGAFSNLPIKNLCDQKNILVAGTNGKGTTAKTLQTLLTENNKYVGMFTSPYLISICESIQIDGKPISEELFVECFHHILDLHKKWNLSYFETLTLMASYLFFAGRLLPPVEYAIFEVGMGGLWDATNVVPHNTSIITQISYDHQHLLGHTLEEIAKNKLGIVHENNHKVIHHQVIGLSVFDENPKLHQLKQQTLQKTKAIWHYPAECSYQTEIINGEPKGFISIYNQKQEMNLLGQRAAENSAMALKCYEVLGFDPKKALKSLKKVKWEGRMHREHLSFCKCPVYFSGDHNGQGIKSLIAILKDLRYQNIYFLVGIGQTKNPKDILLDLFNVKNSKIYLTTAQFRGRGQKDYMQWIDRVNGYIKNPVKALKQVCRQCQKDDLMVVTGSLYLIGELMSYTRGNKTCKNLHPITTTDTLI